MTLGLFAMLPGIALVMAGSAHGFAGTVGNRD